MKKMEFIKKLGVFLAFGLLCVPAFSQVSGGQSLPFDENTKNEWIQTHSAQYQQMLGLSGAGTTAPMELTEAQKRAALGLPDLNDRGERLVPEPIAENPVVYSASQMKQKISRAEFEALPANKQQSVLNDPKFIIYED